MNAGRGGRVHFQTNSSEKEVANVNHPPVHPSLTYREWQNARASAAVDDPVVDAVADAGAGPEAVAVADGPPIYPDDGPRRSKRFAVVVLQVADSKWRPRDGNAVMPGGHLAAMDTRLQAEFVLPHNANEVQRRRGAFAILTIKGGVVVLYAVSQKQRPADPGGLPVHAINGFTRDEAVAECPADECRYAADGVHSTAVGCRMSFCVRGTLAEFGRPVRSVVNRQPPRPVVRLAAAGEGFLLLHSRKAKNGKLFPRISRRPDYRHHGRQ